MLYLSLLTAYLLLSSFDFDTDSFVGGYTLRILQHKNNNHLRQLIYNFQNEQCTIATKSITSLHAVNNNNNNNHTSSNVLPKLNFDEDFYSVLEVSPSADNKAVKKAYLKMVFKVEEILKLYSILW